MNIIHAITVHAQKDLYVFVVIVYKILRKIRPLISKEINVKGMSEC